MTNNRTGRLNKAISLLLALVLILGMLPTSVLAAEVSTSGPFHDPPAYGTATLASIPDKWAKTVDINVKLWPNTTSQSNVRQYSDAPFNWTLNVTNATATAKGTLTLLQVDPTNNYSLYDGSRLDGDWRNYSIESTTANPKGFSGLSVTGDISIKDKDGNANEVTFINVPDTTETADNPDCYEFVVTVPVVAGSNTIQFQINHGSGIGSDGTTQTITFTVPKGNSIAVTYSTGELSDSAVANMPSGDIPQAQQGEGYTLPTTAPTATDYSFIGWEFNGVTYDAGATVPHDDFDDEAGPITFTASWSSTPNEYAVTFYHGSKTLTTSYVTSGHKVAQPPEPVEVGYQFLGWYKDKAFTTPFDFATAITENTSVYGKFEEVTKTYKVTFLADGKQHEKYTDIEHNEKIYAPTDPVKANCTFGGWYADESYAEAVTFPLAITANTTLYAKFTEIGSCTITYDSGVTDETIGVPAKATVAENGKYIVSLYTPVRDGYTFLGWDKDNDDDVDYYIGDEIPSVTANMTLTAVWQKNEVTVIYPNLTATPIAGVASHNGSGGSVPQGSTQTFTVTYHAGYQLPTVTANGVALAAVATSSPNVYQYTFVANADTEIKIGAPQKLSFTVILSTSNEYTAVFTAPNGYADRTQAEVEYGGSYTFSVKAQKGYTVSSVKVNGEEQLTNGATIDSTTAQSFQITNVTSAQNIIIVASEIPYHLVTYVTNTGSMTTVYVQEGQSIPLPKLPDTTGYSFFKWFTTQDMTNVAADNLTMGNADVTLYGMYIPWRGTIKFDANTTDTVTWVSETGKEAIPTTIMKVYGQSVQLIKAVPVREGYTFLGWSTASGATVATYAPGSQYSTEIDKKGGTVTLYAVWQQNTYTITLPASGEGFGINPKSSTTVAHGSDFSFDVVVDRNYAENFNPTTMVTMNPTTDGKGTLSYTGATGNDATTGAVTYTYTITGVKENKTISVSVTPNTQYKVTFKNALVEPDDTWTVETGTESTQYVTYGYYAEQPAAPRIDGYTFAGWYTLKSAASSGSEAETDSDVSALADEKWSEVVDKPYTFDKVTANTVVYAKMVKNQYTVSLPADGTGWEITFSGTDNAAGAQTTKVDHGDSVTFTITVKEGYDASNMQVGVNGQLWAPKSIASSTSNPKDTVYTYEISNITEDKTVTVTLVERKTITITYWANGLDDTAGWAGMQTVRYYLEGLDNDTITDKQPTRYGYKFLGWSLDPNRDPAKFNMDEAIGSTSTEKYADRDFVAGDTVPFTSNTDLYAVWQAEELTVTLTFGNTFQYGSETTLLGGTLDYAYEGSSIQLTATLNQSAQGTVTFYRTPATSVGSKTDTSIKTTQYDTSNWTPVGSVQISGNQVSISTTVRAYRGFAYDDTYKTNLYRNDRDVYKAVFTPTAEEGYVTCESVDDLRIWSTAIAWDNPRTDYETKTDNTLKIYSDKDFKTEVTEMVASGTYYLKLPAVYEFDGGYVLKQMAANVADADLVKTLSVDKDYKVIWEYEDSKNHWTTFSATTSGDDWLQVTPEYVNYSFRAKVVPSSTSIYDKAAQYAAVSNAPDTVILNSYVECLYTKATVKTALQSTTTALAITGAENESNQVLINNTTPFAENESDTGTHLAQFEDNTVTLTATVTDNATSKGVAGVGYVNFYRVGTTDALNDKPVAVGTNGVATFNAATSAYSGEAIDAKDQYYAVYLANDTYDTSDSRGDEPDASTSPVLATVYIKSTSIQTPIIESNLPGMVEGVTGEATATTYAKDLTDLLAGVTHTFTLRADGATEDRSADWSVVALDGRTVANTDYTIQWLKKTGSNEETNAAQGNQFVSEDNKVGDKFRVRLNPTGNMTVGAESKYAIIGKLQDVTVTVKAIDAITSTDATDVYQLNPITLTATVEGKDTGVSMKPTGNVAFYYRDKDKGNWSYLDTATLELDSVNKIMTASITTTALPVTEDTFTMRELDIYAIYLGDTTFTASATATEITETGKYNIMQETTNKSTTKKDNVTVYSSVVYVTDIQNTTTSGSEGIYITTEYDKILNNETNVNLMLSDIYTRDILKSVDEKISKLTYGTDYTVQWQKLTNAAAYSSKYAAADTPWTNIDGGTNVTCQIDVEQSAAYRAVITVKDTAIAKGSFTEVKQGETDALTNGFKTYYSNILVAAEALSTLTVNINTDNVSDGFEGIVQGETVTIHTFTSGSTYITPISELTAKITKEITTSEGTTNTVVVFEETKANVNGHASFTWGTENVKGLESDDVPDYYTLTLTAKYTNGYSDKTITRTLIVRDNDYGFKSNTEDNIVTYNGKAQGLDVSVTNMGIENQLAQDSVVVYYYADEARTQQVEPTQAGTYYATIRLQESAYWTEKTENVTFRIEPREVKVVDLVAQAKVYDGTNHANILEIILNDAETDQDKTGLPKDTEDTGIINGDSVYAIGSGVVDKMVGEAKLSATNIKLKGDDAANYTLVNDYKEVFNIQRNQVQGDIANATYRYTGSSITVPADDIYLIDQAGNQLNASQYTVTYYYHSGDGVQQVSAMKWKGMYTVIARPDQTNYKGGASQVVYVADEAVDAAPSKDFHSTLITIGNTVELYGKTEGIEITTTNGATVKEVTYNGSSTVPTNAGRYLVKVTTPTGDTAYGIYTIVKANPVLTLEAKDVTYDSAQQKGYTEGSYNGEEFPEGTYYSYTGGTIQGVSYTAPTEAGTYVVTAHVPETANYTAHEVSAVFTIAPKALTITADSPQRHQYGAYPDLTASFAGLATGGVAPDTSLRDVQIQPELIFDEKYTNSAYDQVGNNYSITPIAALARNYTVSYKQGNESTTEVDPNPVLAIHGMIQNGTGDGYIAYYGDKIQLYPYGSQNADKTIINNSSVLEWSVRTGDPATINEDGLLEITGVGEVVVTLKRGVGKQQISTSITIKTLKQEVKVEVPNVDKVYNGTLQTYDGTVEALNGKLTVVSATTIVKDEPNYNGSKRTDVGSQVTTYVVSDDLYQSEVYGGLFTINDKEATVTPTEQSTVYGKKLTSYAGNGYTVTDDNAISNVKVGSVADAYANLDVHDGYEILVAGTEDMNYNVKYVTDQKAPDAKVTEKGLTFTTGVIGSDGRTSGYMQSDRQYYKDEGFTVTDKTFNGTPNDRMYGEVNPAMSYKFEGLIPGDSEADLAALLPWLTKYSNDNLHNINGDANVKFNKTEHLSGYRATAANEFISGTLNNYEIDSLLAADGVKNYTIATTNNIEATQNIYQRPVTLTVREGVTLTAYKPDVIKDGVVDKDAVRQLLLNNLEVGKYEGVGGLATLLGHTIDDLKITVKTATYDGSKITIKITLGNQNYWVNDSNELTFEMTVETSKIIATYGKLGDTRSTVTMIGVDEDGNRTGPVNVTGTVTYYIYEKVEGLDKKYSNYRDRTPVRVVTMTKGSGTGVYIAEYARLPKGNYVMFAIAEDYTIIE